MIVQESMQSLNKTLHYRINVQQILFKKRNNFNLFPPLARGKQNIIKSTTIKALSFSSTYICMLFRDYI